MSNIKRQPVLINDEYLRAYSLFPKNYDFTEIENFIPLAEQIHIQSIIGMALYEELLDQVTNNNLTDENSTLLLEIYKVEGLAVLYEALPFCWAHLSQVGITLGKSDNSDSIANKDISYINTHIKAQLDYAKRYLKKWLETYSDNFPLYIKEEELCDCPVQKPSLGDDIYTLPKDKIDLV